MEKRWKWALAAVFGVCMLWIFTRGEAVEDAQKINDILAEQRYMQVFLGEGYHQSEVWFDMENDRAVVPESAAWGLSKCRNREMMGVNYGEVEGVDVYESDRESHPEMYRHFYMDSIRSLNLTVGEVRENDYCVNVVKKQPLALFEKELVALSGMVLNENYELSGVWISFDKRFRPIKKIFELRKKDSTKLQNTVRDSEKCTQEFSYHLGKIKFEMGFRKVKKEIERGGGPRHLSRCSIYG